MVRHAMLKLDVSEQQDCRGLSTCTRVSFSVKWNCDWPTRPYAVSEGASCDSDLEKQLVIVSRHSL